MTVRAALAAVLDARYLAWSAAAAVVGLASFGVVGAIIPNPVFGRQIPPEPFAIVTWIGSGLLMGLLAGTYLARPPAAPAAVRLPGDAFLAIGCPVCNKVALVLLGASGALSIWAPLQPLLGLVSVALLAGALAWRLRMRALGSACPVT
jgi:hypothetical protein